MLLGHKQGLERPGWVAWARAFDVRPETPSESSDVPVYPRDISFKLSQNQHPILFIHLLYFGFDSYE